MSIAFSQFNGYKHEHKINDSNDCFRNELKKFLVDGHNSMEKNANSDGSFLLCSFSTHISTSQNYFNDLNSFVRDRFQWQTSSASTICKPIENIDILPLTIYFNTINDFLDVKFHLLDPLFSNLTNFEHNNNLEKCMETMQMIWTLCIGLLKQESIKPRSLSLFEEKHEQQESERNTKRKRMKNDFQNDELSKTMNWFLHQFSHNNNSKNGNSKLLLLHFTVHPFPLFNMNAENLWYECISELIWRKGYLQAENLFCQTLGAAYASISRDRNEVRFATNAKDFAERQLIIAKKLDDKDLERKARTYIGYYFMFIGDYDSARTIISAQRNNVQHDSVNDMIVAALFRIDLLEQHELEHNHKHKAN